MIFAMDQFAKAASDNVIKRCKENKLPISMGYDIAKCVWEIYWEEIRKDEQNKKDLGLERTHYMVE